MPCGAVLSDYQRWRHAISFFNIFPLTLWEGHFAAHPLENFVSFFTKRIVLQPGPLLLAASPESAIYSSDWIYADSERRRGESHGIT